MWKKPTILIKVITAYRPTSQLTIVSPLRLLAPSLLSHLCWVTYALRTFRPIATLPCSFLMPLLSFLVMSYALGVLETWISANRLRLKSSKPIFIWLGIRQQLAKQDLAAIAADFPISLFHCFPEPWSYNPTKRSECKRFASTDSITFAPNIN